MRTDVSVLLRNFVGPEECRQHWESVVIKNLELGRRHGPWQPARDAILFLSSDHCRGGGERERTAIRERQTLLYAR